MRHEQPALVTPLAGELNEAHAGREPRQSGGQRAASAIAAGFGRGRVRGATIR
jgi:hypothetical protein